jgi:Zn-dependent peptidase ImmA (M78 family)
MQWVKDRTGRFSQRPHYLPAELDAECENLVCDFLRSRHQNVRYPISTDDLTVLLETLADDLDLYTDLSQEEGEVEGVTDFFRGRRPKVRISKRLSSDPRLLNRFRTTLTHELGHVKFHAFMFDGPSSGSLFPSESPELSNKCKRETILEANQTDWMEWQAGFACGAFLMPASALREAIRLFMDQRKAAVARFAVTSPEGEALINAVVSQFQVSRDAARVRLAQRGALTEAGASATLF